MAARKKSYHSLAFVLGVFSIALGAYLYKNVLPYHFSPQWQPTPDELNQGKIYDRAEEKGEFLGQTVSSYEIPEPKKLASVLGQNDGTNKRIEVDLTNQRVYAYEGDKKVFEFVVSTGKWNWTPTGSYTIQYKTRVQKMSGGNRALNTYYYLPNVPYVQFFGNSEIPWSRGFSFHGTYWHSNFGYPMSHGCVNMKTADAEKLYYWTAPVLGEKRTVQSTPENQGTPVIIYGKTPRA
ncbi:MAG: L,D-transpeptidase [Patescibacteria group bacterium]